MASESKLIFTDDDVRISEDYIYKENNYYKISFTDITGLLHDEAKAMKIRILQSEQIRQRAEEELRRARKYRESHRSGTYNQGDANADLVIEILEQIVEGDKK